MKFPVLALAVSTAMCGRSQAPPSLGRVEGTYELLICRGGCGGGDTSRAYIRGTLTLTDSTLLGVHQYALGSGPANGCFDLRRLHELNDSYAGITRDHVIHWIQDGDTLEFPIYESPDAAYDIELTRAASGLHGWGSSSGVGMAEIHAPKDSVWLQRVADADPRRCVSLR